MKTKQKIILSFILIVVVIGFTIKIQTDRVLLKQGRFSIATINSKVGSAKGGTVYNYSFKINSKLIKGKRGSASKGIIGTRYFVIYNPANLKENRILLNIPVPDSITEVPLNGWEKLPIDIDENAIKDGFR